MVIGPVVLGLLLWNFGVSRFGIMVAALFVNLSPIVAVSLLALAGKPPTGAQVVGGLLVIGGVVWCEARAMWRGRNSHGSGW
jgi:drug/metabolite transporter (DMT)-like permease